jgi:hypothetical protein
MVANLRENSCGAQMYCGVHWADCRSHPERGRGDLPRKKAASRRRGDLRTIREYARFATSSNRRTAVLSRA